MRVTVIAVSGAIAASAAALLLACASPNIPDDPLADPAATDPTPKKTPAKKDAGSGTGTGSEPTPAPTGGGTPPPPPNQADAAPPPAPTNACAASATATACFSCCESANPTALPFLDNQWGKCLCQAPGACAFACAVEYCSGGPVKVGGSCDACLAANDGTCRTQAESACNADATCKNLFLCDSDSKCVTKP